jgi:hypothetical protein
VRNPTQVDPFFDSPNLEAALDGTGIVRYCDGTPLESARGALRMFRGHNVTQQLGDIMSNLRIDELTAELHADDMDKVHGGIWDYSNRLGLLGQQLEDRHHPVVVGGNGPSIEDAANYGDDSSYYPGLTPLR